METLTPHGATTLDVRAELRASLSNGHPPDLAVLRAAPRGGGPSCPDRRGGSTAPGGQGYTLGGHVYRRPC